MNTKMEVVQAVTALPESRVESLLRTAVEAGHDAQAVSQLVQLYREERDYQSRMAYANALAAAQAAMPSVARDAHNQQTGSKYAKLEKVQKAIMPVLQAHGFAISYGFGNEVPGGIRVVADVHHIAGHKERYHLDLAIDNLGPKGSPTKTLVHGTGASITYAQRRLLCMIANVVLVDEDDDGNSTGAAISEDQADTIKTLLKTAKGDEAAFCKVFHVGFVEDIPASRFNEAMSLIARKIGREQP